MTMEFENNAAWPAMVIWAAMSILVAAVICEWVR